jgi:hypothetical protein
MRRRSWEGWAHLLAVGETPDTNHETTARFTVRRGHAETHVLAAARKKLPGGSTDRELRIEVRLIRGFRSRGFRSRGSGRLVLITGLRLRV